MESSKKTFIYPLLLSFCPLFINELNKSANAEINSAVEQNKIIDQFKIKSIKPISKINILNDETNENKLDEGSNKEIIIKKKSNKAKNEKIIKAKKEESNKEIISEESNKVENEGSNKVENEEIIKEEEVNTKSFSKDTILIKSVDVVGNTTYKKAELVNVLKPLIGKRVTFAELNKYSFKLQSKFRKDGYITTKVIIPQQSFKNGFMFVKVVEGYIEDINVRGKNKKLVKYVQNMLEPIKTKKENSKTIFDFNKFERQILLIKKVNNVDLVSNLTKGSKFGGTILIVDLVPKSRSLALFSDSNISTKLGDYVTGSRISYTTKNINPIKMGGILKYGFPVREGLISGLGIIEKPLNVNGLTAKVLYSYSSTKSSDLFSTTGIQTSEGTSKYFSLGLEYPLIIKRDKSLNIGLNGTLQNSFTDLYQDGVKMNNINADRIRALRFNVDSFKRNSKSLNNLNFTLSKGIDGLDNTLNNDQFKSNPEGNDSFTTAKLNISRNQYIGKKGFNLKLLAKGQLSSDKLPIPEQFSYGGSSIGKGFTDNHLFGDQGWAIQGKLSKDIINMKKNSFISPYIWYDYGSVTKRFESDSGAKAATYGVGFSRAFKSLNLDLGYGIPGFSTVEGAKTGNSNGNFYFNFDLKI